MEYVSQRFGGKTVPEEKMAMRKVQVSIRRLACTLPVGEVAGRPE
jgi:hypothetical protein